jgi:hypothetical protein
MTSIRCIDYACVYLDCIIADYAAPRPRRTR